ncbi:elongation factor P maturation arginine rhamnosyltransferase EarP [Pandoraea terrae]|uniref:Protein-arginine rhamnosyltransferase n=1 Tax=Pandoraea terrae TaxID=1537710 RepID=A0A5E4TWK2_9BURK|nr:elongation factor P maturation arginine rhamnosyltransferase EarP [Pandoraea terrae]VVD92255.1 elongation factor P maturation arginine rhamnosyltransferase EarP [Pandoraea terrae]
MVSPRALRCDIFCTVVDNYGDIGVCWRLARQFAREHGWQVRLWVDDLKSFARLRPEIDADRAAQTFDGVDVRRWGAPFAECAPAEVVIEAFACNVPDPYLRAMQAQKTAGKPPAWINLEYLSAEDWVGDCHLQRSVHPQLGLAKTFFFPGFTAKTGGLARENDLFARRDTWLASEDAQNADWQALGLPPKPEHALTISLFAYENAALPSLLDQWAAHDRPVVCLAPQGRIVPAVAHYFGREALPPGASATRGALTVHGLPFVPQDRFDALLWGCDLNFVRGEDSFVRAQWAAKPFVWHIYPQEDDAHRDKLDAFLAQYLAHVPAPDAPPPLAAPAVEALRTFWHLWNGFAQVRPNWPALSAQLPALAHHARAWAAWIGARSDLAQQLARFAENQVK